MKFTIIERVEVDIEANSAEQALDRWLHGTTNHSWSYRVTEREVLDENGVIEVAWVGP